MWGTSPVCLLTISARVPRVRQSSLPGFVRTVPMRSYPSRPLDVCARAGKRSSRSRGHAVGRWELITAAMVGSCAAVTVEVEASPPVVHFREANDVARWARTGQRADVKMQPDAVSKPPTSFVFTPGQPGGRGALLQFADQPEQHAAPGDDFGVAIVQDIPVRREAVKRRRLDASPAGALRSRAMERHSRNRGTRETRREAPLLRS
jgi:hypothetical protein